MRGIRRRRLADEPFRRKGLGKAERLDAYRRAAGLVEGIEGFIDINCEIRELRAEPRAVLRVS